MDELVTMEKNKLRDLVQNLSKTEKAIRGVNKKIVSLQSKIQKETEQMSFLKDLNDTLLRGQARGNPAHYSISSALARNLAPDSVFCRCVHRRFSKQEKQRL